jgi:hypothetical protein
MMLTRAFMEGLAPDEWPGGSPAIEAALDALIWTQADAASPEVEREIREVLMTITAMQTVMLVLDEADRDRARERLMHSVERVLDQALPAPDASRQTIVRAFLLATATGQRAAAVATVRPVLRVDVGGSMWV